MANWQRVKDLREALTVLAAQESEREAAKVADRERSGLLMRPNGTLVRKRKRDGVYVSAIKSTGHSTSVTQRSQVQTRPGAEVLAWDAMVKADRALVAAGCRSRLVKVLKGNGRPVTAMEIAMKHADVSIEAVDIMAMLKAAVSGAK